MEGCCGAGAAAHARLPARRQPADLPLPLLPAATWRHHCRRRFLQPGLLLKGVNLLYDDSNIPAGQVGEAAPRCLLSA